MLNMTRKSKESVAQALLQKLVQCTGEGALDMEVQESTIELHKNNPAFKLAAENLSLAYEACKVCAKRVGGAIATKDEENMTPLPLMEFLSAGTTNDSLAYHFVQAWVKLRKLRKAVVAGDALGADFAPPAVC